MSVTETLYLRWKSHKGFSSDRQALSALGVSHGAAVHWKQGRNADVHVIEAMANDLGENAGKWVTKAMQEQARGPAAKTWERLAKQLGSAAAMFSLVALAPLSQPAKAVQNQGLARPDFAYSVYYVNIEP